MVGLTVCQLERVSQIVLVCFGAALSGCASKPVYHLEEERAFLPALDASAPLTRLPVTVGLYVSENLRGQTGRKDSVLGVPVSETVVPYIEWATRQLFSNVVLVESVTPNRLSTNQVAGIIEIKDASFFSLDIVLHAVDKPPVTWTIAGYSTLDSHAVGWPRFSSSSLRDVLAQYVVDFDKERVRADWIIGLGATSAEVGPNFNDVDSAPESNRVVVRGNEGAAKACLEDHSANSRKPVPLLPIEEFRRALFPWFEPGTAPRDDEAMVRLLERPTIQARLHALGIRYLLDFDGGTSKTGDMYGTCSYGCLAGGGGTRKTSYHVKLSDLWKRETAISAEIEESGNWVAGIFVIIPFGFASPTETRACDRFARTFWEAIAK